MWTSTNHFVYMYKQHVSYIIPQVIYYSSRGYNNPCEIGKLGLEEVQLFIVKWNALMVFTTTLKISFNP